MKIYITSITTLINHLNMIQTSILFLLLINVGLLFGTGEKREVNVSKLRQDKDLQEIFREAIDKYNNRVNSIYSYAPYQVHSIRQQVVAGILYEFEVTLIGTNCRNEPKRSNQLLSECGLNEKLSPKRAKLQIVSTPWLEPKYSFKVLSEIEEHDLKLHDQLFVIGLPDGEVVSGLNFDSFKKNFNKLYENDEEEEKRFKIFHTNYKKALLMNRLDKGSAVYGITQFSDLTDEEFRSQYLSPEYDLSKKPKRIAQIPQDIRTAQAVDWRTLGGVTVVKNQGQCGSCWAFSTTGNIEGQWFLKTKRLISLSEQQLVDCDTIDQGCNGGLPSQAYKAIQQMGGLESESDYPYEARKGNCVLDKSKIVVYINGSASINSSESSMADWCSINGPISIGINAFAMQFYRGGISHPFSIFCNPSHLDHGVLIVGFNSTTSGEPYWIVKNSWGENWGENGYYLVYRGSGVCGLNKMPTTSIINLN